MARRSWVTRRADSARFPRMRLAVVASGLAFAVSACGSDSGSPRRRAVPRRAARASTRIHGDALGDGVAPDRHTIHIDGQNDFTARRDVRDDVVPDVHRVRLVGRLEHLRRLRGAGSVDHDLRCEHEVAVRLRRCRSGASTGAATADKYGTQDAVFPMGFGAEYYLRFKSDGTFSSLEKYDGTVWDQQATAPVSANSGTYTEAAFSRSLLTGTTAGVVTYMIDEKLGGESTFAGLYTDNFTDGYGSGGPVMTHYIGVDFTSPKDSELFVVPPADDHRRRGRRRRRLTARCRSACRPGRDRAWYGGDCPSRTRGLSASTGRCLCSSSCRASTRAPRCGRRA